MTNEIDTRSWQIEQMQTRISELEAHIKKLEDPTTILGMKYRPLIGGLSESMKECVILEPTIAALQSHLGRDEVTVESYWDKPDDRIGWERTFIVLVLWHDGQRIPMGYTDQMPNS